MGSVCLPTQGSKLLFPQSIDLKKCFDSEKQKVFRPRLLKVLLHPKKIHDKFFFAHLFILLRLLPL